MSFYRKCSDCGSNPCVCGAPLPADCTVFGKQVGVLAGDSCSEPNGGLHRPRQYQPMVRVCPRCEGRLEWLWQGNDLVGEKCTGCGDINRFQPREASRQGVRRG
jgi:hypothetical protein